MFNEKYADMSAVNTAGSKSGANKTKKSDKTVLGSSSLALHSSLNPNAATISARDVCESSSRESRPYAMILDEPLPTASNIQSGSGCDQFPAAVQAADLARQRKRANIQNKNLMEVEPTPDQMAMSRLSMNR